jgi:hypothetical protein
MKDEHLVKLFHSEECELFLEKSWPKKNKINR